ncbi:M23 family metallopeptidase [Halalkalibacillus sediminis]|nr:M23 family metallopeptidase [Halalkalibacillus sediminis]
MNENERKYIHQSKWKRLTRQRWFYPTLYITLVAVVLTGILLYQFQTPETTSNDTDGMSWDEEQDDLMGMGDSDEGEDAEPVVAQQEDLVMPVLLGENAEIMTKFYDVNASEEDQQQALIFYNNQYYQSKGVDITSKDGETFEVIAALSGTVTMVDDDELRGQVIEIEHEGERTTVYSSLSEVNVSEGDEVSQGDVIGTSGENVYGEPDVTKVHFEMIEDGTYVDPGFH